MSSYRVEIRQFGKEIASFPAPATAPEDVQGGLEERDFTAATAVAEALYRHHRMVTGYYEVVLTGPIGDSGLRGELDGMEAIL